MTAKTKNRSIEYVLVTILLMYCINVPYSIFSFKYYEWIPLTVDFLIILFSLFQKGLRIKVKLLKELCVQFFFPLIIPSIIAAVAAVVLYHNIRYTPSSFKYILWVLGAYFLGYCLYKRYRFKLFSLILTAGSLSYLTTIMKALIYRESGYLEVHELTYIYGILFTFIVLGSEIPRRNKNIMIMVCLLGIVLGNKRGLWLGLAMAFGIYFIFYKILKNKKKGLIFVSTIAILVGMFWVWFIYNGYFELMCLRFGINDMSRLKMWNYFRNSYTFSPLYVGRGLTYTLVVMDEIHNLLFISTAIPIHNWVLSTYIGWGFIPLVYYLYVFLYKRVMIMHNKGYKNTPWVFLAVSIVFYIINFFGDTMFNIGISIAYIAIWLYLQEDAKSNARMLDNGK